MFSIQTKEYGKSYQKTVIVLGGWKTNQLQFWLLGQLLSSYHFKTIVVTWDAGILTPDPKVSLERFTQVKESVIATITSLPKSQQKHLSLFGISQGTIIAAMVARESKGIEKLILNLSGSDLAEIIWSWDKSVKGFKKQMLRKGVSLPKLKKIWSPLSPLNNFKESNVHDVLFYMAVHDELIPYNLQEKLLQALQSDNIRVEAIVNERHSHLKSAVVNLLRFPTYITFLRRPSTVRHPKKLK